MAADLYLYRVVVTDVIDADTFVCDVDLGFGVWRRKTHFRLYGINAPEMNTPEGKAARLFAIKLVNAADLEKETAADWPDPLLYVRSHKDKADKYGRLLGEFYGADLRESLNTQLLEAGHAVRAPASWG